MATAHAHSSREDRMRLTRLFAASLPLVFVACAGFRPAYEVPITPDDVTTTHVVNTNTFPVAIYLTQAGMRHRLGEVESLSAGLFAVPPKLLGGRRDFRLLAVPLGPHPTYVSETFMLQPGQSAAWRVREAADSRAALVSLVTVR